MKHVFPLYQFLYRHLPYFNYPRVPGRIIVLTFLGLSVLAGVAVGKIQAWGGKRRRLGSIVAAALLLGILIDFFPARPAGISLAGGEREVYRTIREDIGGARVLELPIWPGDTAWSSLYLYNVTYTRARMLNGYYSMVSRDYVDNIFSPLYNLDFGEMREEQYALLKKLNVKYIVMHNEAYPFKVSPYPFSFALENLKNSRYVQLLRHEEPLWLFRLRDEPSPEPAQVFSRSSVIGTMYQAEWLAHKGRIQEPEPEASGNRVVAGDVSRDREGHLVYGKYRTFPAGRYKAVFRLKADKVRDPEKGVVRIEVVTDGGREFIEEETLYAKDFGGGDAYQDFVLGFGLQKPRKLEFRVYFYQKVNVWVDYVYIVFADQEDPRAFYEAEDLFHTGRQVSDPQGSGGSSIYSRASVHPRGYVTKGPYRLYPPGRYEVSFRLKVDTISKDEVARIEVRRDRRRDELAVRGIRGTQFKGPEAFTEFRLTFDLEAPSALEFLVFFNSHVDLWFDKVEVRRKKAAL